MDQYNYEKNSFKSNKAVKSTDKWDQICKKKENVFITMKNKDLFFRKISQSSVSLWRISKVDVISTRNLNDEQIAVNEYFE